MSSAQTLLQSLARISWSSSSSELGSFAVIPGGTSEHCLSCAINSGGSGGSLSLLSEPGINGALFPFFLFSATASACVLILCLALWTACCCRRARAPLSERDEKAKQVRRLCLVRRRTALGAKANRELGSSTASPEKGGEALSNIASPAAAPPPPAKRTVQLLRLPPTTQQQQQDVEVAEEADDNATSNAPPPPQEVAEGGGASSERRNGEEEGASQDAASLDGGPPGEGQDENANEAEILTELPNAIMLSVVARPPPDTAPPPTSPIDVAIAPPARSSESINEASSNGGGGGGGSGIDQSGVRQAPQRRLSRQRLRAFRCGLPYPCAASREVIQGRGSGEISKGPLIIRGEVPSHMRPKDAVSGTVFRTRRRFLTGRSGGGSGSGGGGGSDMTAVPLTVMSSRDFLCLCGAGLDPCALGVCRFRVCCGAGGCCMPPPSMAADADDASPNTNTRGVGCCHKCCCSAPFTRSVLVAVLGSVALLSALAIAALYAPRISSNFLSAGTGAIFSAIEALPLGDAATYKALKDASVDAQEESLQLSLLCNANPACSDTLQTISSDIVEADLILSGVLRTDYEGIHGNVRALRDAASAAFAVVFSVLSITALLVSGWAAAVLALLSGCCAGKTRGSINSAFGAITVFVSPLVLSLLCLVTAVVMGPLLLLSDACAAPSQTVAAVLQNASNLIISGSSAALDPSVLYGTAYQAALACAYPPPPPYFSGTVGIAVQYNASQAAWSAGSAALVLLEQTIMQAGNPWWDSLTPAAQGAAQGYASGIGSDLTQLTNAAAASITALSCQDSMQGGLMPQWNSLVEGACNEILPALAVSTVLLLTATLLFLIFASFAAFYAAFIPGVGCCAAAASQFSTTPGGPVLQPHRYACPCVLAGRILILQEEEEVVLDQDDEEENPFLPPSKKKKKASKGRGGAAAASSALGKKWRTTKQHDDEDLDLERPFISDTATASEGGGGGEAEDEEDEEAADAANITKKSKSQRGADLDIPSLLSTPKHCDTDEHYIPTLDLTRLLSPLELALVIVIQSVDSITTVAPLCCARSSSLTALADATPLLDENADAGGEDEEDDEEAGEGGEQPDDRGQSNSATG